MYDPRTLMSIPLGALALVLVTSLAWSGFDVCRKFLVGRVKPVPLVFLLTAASVPLFALWAGVEGMPEIQPGYALPALLSIVLNVGANLLFFVALRTSPLSVTIPLLSFTPVFTTLLAIPMLGEVPAPVQVAGILLVVAGAFVLNLAAEEPVSLAALWHSWRRERGAAEMILVALLWSLTVPLDKMAAERSSGPFHGMILCTGVAAGVFLVLLFQRRLGELADARGVLGVLALALIISTLALGLQLLAIQKILVGFVETLKRGIGNVMAVILGSALFGEEITLRKVLAVGLMAAGVALILV